MTMHEDPRSDAPDAGRVLDRLLEEARTMTPPDVDWNKVDASLFERVQREAGHTQALAAHRGPWRSWTWLGGLAAAAAMAALAIAPVTRAHEPASVGATVEGLAGDLTVQQGSGVVSLDGAKARTGAHAQSGQTIETHGARALFEASGRVSWLLESESKVQIERGVKAGSTLVLALTRGAVEAQITPVASGEAFAIDVEGVRIAVHGTHLRVSRDGDHVSVDLSEGVVSIGAPPKVGSTYGTLVTAPAHVEFQVGALASSISIDHDAASVRKATELREVAGEAGAARGNSPSSSSSSRASREEAALTPLPAAPGPGLAPRPTIPILRSSAAAAAPNPLADGLVASAVRACASFGPHSTNVTITVSSTLTVEVQDDGFAHLANFDPPLAPGIQQCASQAIYSTRFASPGPHKISIELER
jgi:hypothetical protein